MVPLWSQGYIPRAIPARRSWQNESCSSSGKTSLQPQSQESSELLAVVWPVGYTLLPTSPRWPKHWESEKAQPQGQSAQQHAESRSALLLTLPCHPAPQGAGFEGEEKKFQTQAFMINCKGYYLGFYVSPVYGLEWLKVVLISDFKTFPLHNRAIPSSAPSTLRSVL